MKAKEKNQLPVCPLGFYECTATNGDVPDLYPKAVSYLAMFGYSVWDRGSEIMLVAVVDGARSVILQSRVPRAFEGAVVRYAYRVWRRCAYESA